MGYDDFELTRNKYIQGLSFENLIKGPMPSLDNNYLMYICVETNQIEKDLETTKDPIERKDMF